jgi:hypothetical protein
MITKTNLFSVAMVTLLFSCGQAIDKKEAPEDAEKVKFEDKQFPPVVNVKDLKATNMVPTMQHTLDKGKNTIYATAFLYAWDEVRALLDGPLTVKEDKSSDFYLVNASNSHKGTLQKDEYTASAFDVGDGIVAEASFKKLLPFAHKMTRYTSDFKFNGASVQAFGTNYYDEDVVKNQLQILYYKNDDDFIIRLNPKDTAHELILIKSPTYGNTFEGVLKDMGRKEKLGKTEAKAKATGWKYEIRKGDMVSIPSISFNVETNYKGLEGHTFYDTESHLLNVAYQRTAFLLDEEGAIVESVGYASADSVGAEPVKVEPKHMLFNKPFVVFVKRKDAANPYFALMVNNAELLVPFKE